MDKIEKDKQGTIFHHQILTNNILKDMECYDTDQNLYNSIIYNFTKIYDTFGVHIMIFSVNNQLELSIHSCSERFPSEIIKQIFSSMNKEKLSYLFYSTFDQISYGFDDNNSFLISNIFSDQKQCIYMGLYCDDEELLKYYNFASFNDSLNIIRNKLKAHKKIGKLSEENYDLKNNINLLKITNTLDEFFMKSMDENDIFSILLLGITAGQGLGFNRAFVFKLNSSKDTLCGERAIGPLDPFEAKTIWEKVDKRFAGFSDILNTYRSSEITEARSNKLIKRISIPLKQHGYNPFQDILYYDKPAFIQFADPFYRYAQDFFKFTGIESFIAVPIKTEQNIFGILLADNKFTNKHPRHDELATLYTIINHASNMIHNIRLYNQLNEIVKSIKSSQKQIDENREKLYKAEKYSIAGEVLEKLAHTLKNPLVSIGGFARSLQKDNISDQKRVKFADILLKEVQRIENILKDVCNISTEASPVLKLDDINDTIRDSIKIIQSEINLEKAKVSLDLDGVLPNIYFDRSQITQVIINIIRNALYAVKKKARKPIIQIKSTKSGEFIVISISDNGIGIDENDIDKLFNAFFSTKEIGTGLGLTISGQIIKNHNGHLTVKSIPDKGSTFYIHLPVEI